MHCVVEMVAVLGGVAAVRAVLSVERVSHNLGLKALVAADKMPGDAERVELMVAAIGSEKTQSVELQNMLITAHGHFGDIESAQKVFDGVELMCRSTI